MDDSTYFIKTLENIFKKTTPNVKYINTDFVLELGK